MGAGDLRRRREMGRNLIPAADAIEGLEAA